MAPARFEGAPLLSRAQSRAVDARLAEAGFPTLALMENAGRGAALVARRVARSLAARAVCVLCGPGNNGGDGFVVARHLAREGFDVRVALLGDEAALRGDALLALRAWRAAGGAVERADERWVRATPEPALFVDALYGTGLARPLEGSAAALVAALEGRAVLALDVPSGLDADAGAPLGPTVRARWTVAFGTAKPGLLTGPGRSFAGRVCVAHLGVPLPAAVLREARAFRVRAGEGAVAPRRGGSHKGEHGRVLVVGGSAGTTGAALLAGQGALRAGAGLVTLASREVGALAGRVTELMTRALDGDAARVGAQVAALLAEARGAVAVVGVGLGRDAWAEGVVRAAWRTPAAVVLDADALALLRAVALEGPAPDEAARVLTPHPLELARLLGHEDVAAVERDRLGAARDAARRYRATVLLKGAGTVVARPDGVAYVLDASEPSLGVAGSGDVLAGAIAARLAERGAPRAPAEACLEAACAHVRAARSLRAARGSSRGLLASELASALGACLEGTAAARKGRRAARR